MRSIARIYFGQEDYSLETTINNIESIMGYKATLRASDGAEPFVQFDTKGKGQIPLNWHSSFNIELAVYE